MHYTGQLPTPCTSGVQYFQIACWGRYIDIQPLTSLNAAQTTQALTASVNFFRKHGITLDTLRMDNQQSYDLRETARVLKLQMEFIAPVWKGRIALKEPFEQPKITSSQHYFCNFASYLYTACYFYVDYNMKKWKNDNIQASDTRKGLQRKLFRRQWDTEKEKDPEFGAVYEKKSRDHAARARAKGAKEELVDTLNRNARRSYSSL